MRNQKGLQPLQYLHPFTNYELMDCYRTWWQSSYGNPPNSQATIIAAAFAEHVLDLVAEQNAKQSVEEPNANA
jgi:hypothetical protein